MNTGTKEIPGQVDLGCKGRPEILSTQLYPICSDHKASDKTEGTSIISSVKPARPYPECVGEEVEEDKG